MFLTQIRYGFATNSSSSHSVILADTPQRDLRVPDDGAYGWDNFLLSSEQAKRDYIFVACRDNFADDWDAFVELVSPSPELLVLETGWNGRQEYPGYIDHESASLMSASTLEGVQELLKWAENPRISIIGGNDNEEWDHGIPGVEFDPWHLKNMRVRKESRGAVYFDRYRGTKIHLFDEPIDFDTYIASAPELVDIKLTDWCDLACKFCYQDSTRKGMHAPFDAIKRIIDDLAEACTFEVALGGGEPMSHPQFSAILDYCKEKDIVPNFTTRNYKALTSPEFKEYTEKCGSVGISIATPGDVRDLLKNIEGTTVPAWKLSLQVAMGAQTAEEFKEMLTLLEPIRSFKGLIMLGYKDVGRGHRAKGNRWYDQNRVDGADPIAIYKDFLANRKTHFQWGGGMPLSMDTEMVRATEGLLERHGVASQLYMKNEGRVSCYIDAVTLRVAPSSYCDESLYRDYNMNIMHIWPEMSEDYYESTKARN